MLCPTTSEQHWMIHENGITFETSSTCLIPNKVNNPNIFLSVLHVHKLLRPMRKHRKNGKCCTTPAEYEFICCTLSSIHWACWELGLICRWLEFNNIRSQFGVLQLWKKIIIAHFSRVWPTRAGWKLSRKISCFNKIEPTPKINEALKKYLCLFARSSFTTIQANNGHLH